MSVLEKICESKREHIRQKQQEKSLDDLKYEIADLPLPCGFLSRMIMNTGPSLIAEVKKASPSKGIIREDFDPVNIAQIYKDAGATCLSVLTDEPYFKGNDQFLIDVKKAVNLPVLRKDFIIDPYQVYESRNIGADCILLIMAALDDTKAKHLYEVALELRLDVLIEVHNLAELERAIKLDPMMIGVNNRDLNTLDVNIKTSFDLIMNIPSAIFKISESGIKNYDDIKHLSDIGYRGFLVGESLMKEDDIGKAVHTLMQKSV
ncbi:MAG: indole-3-glycerol phosphate synthase TrpC [Alphaproteobacteria bacterium]|nr:indole-3-glycerol phosphate synthase TrpC [Alphaproteobacteria bacterium]